MRESWCAAIATSVAEDGRRLGELCQWLCRLASLISSLRPGLDTVAIAARVAQGWTIIALGCVLLHIRSATH